MIERRREGDPTGKWLGLAVFLVGILLLLFVFSRGLAEFTQAGLLQQAPGREAVTAPLIVAAVAKWVLLFLLAYIGSAVAGRGISLYQAARVGTGEEP
ncbi:MAG: hypothetical protein QN122_11655 [Armatimonadota bacterium]|nr:hypothetical protein [Armatimonadota bacterium]MDR7449151.1 hypothetical protein [Armatimonadota bacterium]MDR7480788.1 hypothetical protein [Armatimonadota bacterium]MDR7489238.1 hypothetical protein [Armatimonadota bacterium]MDR7492090.1 hypothetical protein [Armatimonadota bacterium]